MERETQTLETTPSTSDPQQTPVQDDDNSIWRDFVSYSTVHGLHIALGAKTSLVRRALWSLLILFCTFILVVQLYKSCVKYLKYEVRYSTKDVYAKSLPFPAVSICNQNMMRRSRINGTDAQRYLDEFDTLKNTSGYYWNTSSFDIENEVRLHGHKLSEMLKSCIWKRTVKCTADDFVSFFDYSHGLCYSFNTGRDQHAVRDVEASDSSNGLSLILDAQPEEYYGPFSYDATGFKIVIHDQKYYPSMENEALEISPGFNAIIRIKQHQLYALPTPYTNQCGEKELHSSKDYSRGLCFKECQTKELIRQCNCRLLGLPHAAEFNVRQCTPHEMKACGLPAMRTLLFSDCNCPYPCSNVFYSTTMSNAYFPSTHYWKSKFSEMSEVLNGMNETTIRAHQENYRRRVAKVNVFYDSLIVRVVEEKAAYTASDVAGDCGGNMGLFLGCSFLTLCEFVDILILIFRARMKKRTSEVRAAERS